MHFVLNKGYQTKSPSKRRFFPVLSGSKMCRSRGKSVQYSTCITILSILYLRVLNEGLLKKKSIVKNHFKNEAIIIRKFAKIDIESLSLVKHQLLFHTIIVLPRNSNLCSARTTVDSGWQVNPPTPLQARYEFYNEKWCSIHFGPRTERRTFFHFTKSWL